VKVYLTINSSLFELFVFPHLYVFIMLEAVTLYNVLASAL